jgi:hypothetical protein
LALNVYAVNGTCTPPVALTPCGCYADSYTASIPKPRCKSANGTKHCEGEGMGTKTTAAWYKDKARWGVWSGEFEIFNQVMTIEKCSAIAVMKGYKYYGLEYGQE